MRLLFSCTSGAGRPDEGRKDQSRSGPRDKAAIWPPGETQGSVPSVAPPMHLLLSDLCFLHQNVMPNVARPAGVLWLWGHSWGLLTTPLDSTILPFMERGQLGALAEWARVRHRSRPFPARSILTVQFGEREIEEEEFLFIVLTSNLSVVSFRRGGGLEDIRLEKCLSF